MIKHMKAWVELHATELKMDRRAVTALEYGLLAAIIAVGIIGGASSLGTNLTNKFTSIANHIQSGS